MTIKTFTIILSKTKENKNKPGYGNDNCYLLLKKMRYHHDHVYKTQHTWRTDLSNLAISERGSGLGEVSPVKCASLMSIGNEGAGDLDEPDRNPDLFSVECKSFVSNSN